LIFDVVEHGRRRRTKARYQTRVVYPQELKAVLELSGAFELVGWHPNFTLRTRLEQSKHPMMLVAIVRKRGAPTGT
jgi:hypothetical protein